MHTRDDLVDWIVEQLGSPSRGGAVPASGPKAPPRACLEPGPRARRFFTEHEIKKALTPGAQQLTIPKDAIISPLAQEWLALKGIRVVRE